MEPQTNTGQYSIVTLTALGAVMLVLSSAIGAILGPTFFPAPVSQAPFVTQIASANTDIISEDVRVLFGSVTAIKGNSFTLHTQTEGNSALTDRNVTVTSETKVTKVSQKDKKILESEIAEFAKKQDEAKKSQRLILPPDIFLHTVVNVSEVAIGDTVTVTTSENVSTKKEFIASEIELRSIITMPVK